MLSDALFIGKAGELLASKYLNITAGLYMLRKAARWIVTCSGLQPIIICHIYIYIHRYICVYILSSWLWQVVDVFAFQHPTYPIWWMVT